MNSKFRVIKSIYANVLDILLPQVCIGCQSKNEILCQSCLLNTKRSNPIENIGIYALFDYQDPIIKKVIWDLKYYKRFSIGKILGKSMYEILKEEIDEIKEKAKNAPIYVIPVPLSKSRLRNRGYNQAEIIAKEFCACDKNTFELKNNIIIKTIDTIPQARVHNRARRLKNIHGAFQIKNPELVKDKTIIVIDDVTTTGGTIKEIMNLLKKSGAKYVVGFAVAH